MPVKKEVCVGDILHVYNRGVDRRKTFLSYRDYWRFLESMDHCQKYSLSLSSHQKNIDQTKSRESKKELSLLLETLHRYDQPLCSILAYILMPNHYHLLLLETTEGGISKFLQKISNAYTRYFNRRHDRVGSLFQSTFKRVFVDTDEQLLHISRYIHLNPVAAKLVEADKIRDYPWSSFNEYLERKTTTSLCDISIVGGHFKNKQSYFEFVMREFTPGEVESILEKLSLDNDLG